MKVKELTRLELALSQVFSNLEESNKAAKPTPIPSCFHSVNESQIALALSWSYSTQMRAKELTRLELALSQVFSNIE
jgi:hypothetical protein